MGSGDRIDRFAYWRARLARGGEILAPCDGSDLVQFIDVCDSSEWNIRVAEEHTPTCSTPLVPTTPITMNQMVAGIAQGIQVHPKLVWVPTVFLKENKVSPWGDMPMWIPGQG